MSRVELFSRRACLPAEARRAKVGAARLPLTIVALSLVLLAAIGWKSRAGALVLLAAGLAAETPKSAPSAPDDKAPAAPEPSAYEPTSAYTIREIEGWKVYVHNRLLGEKKDLGYETLKLLAVHLYDINRMVPRPALDKLHAVPIWVEAGNPKVECMCYHPSRGWLEGHGFNPEKAGAVELGNPVTFFDWTHHQRAMVLHELTHAYHHQVLGYDNPDIKAAYQAAMKSKSYESVLFYTGIKKRAYACNSDQEYFAELTEAYFSTNDFYPFVRPEIQEFDQAGFKMLKKVWGKP